MVMMVGCTVSSSADGPPEAPAASRALFESLPAATPDTLRGVWSFKVEGATANAEIRFRFTDGKIIGGVLCTSNAGDPIMTLGAEVASTSDDLDKKTGSFTMAATLTMDGKDRNGNTCNGKLDAANWAFVVTGTTVKITSIDPKGSSSLSKVGD